MNLSTITRRTVVFLFAVSLVLMSATSGVAAQSAQPAWASDYYEQFEGMVSTYNEEIGTIVDSGSFGSRVLGGEIVNLRIEASDGTVGTFSFKFDDELRMTELSEGPRDDATVEMRVSKAKFDQIAGDDDPATAFSSAIRSGDIKVKSLGGPVDQIKNVLINGAIELAHWLQNLF